MFETVELGRRVERAEFEAEEPQLRYALLQAQFALQKLKVPVVVLIGGVEGAGKSEVANRLSEWLDVRRTETHAFRTKTDEELVRPRMWRYWLSLPARDQIGLYVRSWYSRPIYDHAVGSMDDASFDREMGQMARFEEMLAFGSVVIVKLWLHIPKDVQSKRFTKLRKKASTKWRVTEDDLERNQNYKRFAASAERAIRLTDGPGPRWNLVEATQKRYRDLEVGRVLLRAMQAAIERAEDSGPEPAARPEPEIEELEPSILDTLDLEQTVSGEDYRKELESLQDDVGRLAWMMHARSRSAVIVFEGWDAAGKGGCIRRVTRSLDARLYRVKSVAAPTDEERGYHYLWRFWRHIPRGGQFTIYDRSWYGRVLVERVEGFAQPEAWKRAYREINDFEQQLVDGGVCLIKFFLHIDQDEQLRRFKERQSIAYKRHKITDEDWRNREKAPQYRRAIEDMVARTSTAIAPWNLIAGNDKKVGRLQVLRRVKEELAAASSPK